ncbi:hypothetical protein HELRODRAFT_92061 [Helobdella robusta]|uniref:Phosphatidic acid phosphatase type 2/haloperoxidase domain-containing protein n=1 Tax=Helobdella robusta TaxID=6412 RepID=T1G8B8_HELRO|nr:hypothetical protein HELRODRAFT_92061 [Helobdella robusta]ESO09784.1 hypothetical protein HELRODRAFT_92061 [Helobdella robusta]
MTNATEDVSIENSTSANGVLNEHEAIHQQPPTATSTPKSSFIRKFINRIDSSDKTLIRVLAICSSRDKLFGFMRPWMKLLEISGHGGIWLIIVPSLFFMAGADKVLKEKLINFQLALLLDILINATIKGIFRRERPEMNVDDQDTILVDKYSLPSGHAARAMLILFFVYSNFQIGSMYFELLRIWVIFVLASRIFMGRHYPSDIVVGMVIGVLESLLFRYHVVWISFQSLMNAINS